MFRVLDLTKDQKSLFSVSKRPMLRVKGVILASAVATGGSRWGRVPPWQRKISKKNREKREKIGKKREKRTNQEEKAKNREGSSILPLLTDRAGYATDFSQGGGTKWKGGYADVRLRTVAFFAPQVLRSPLIFLKMWFWYQVLFFIFAFSLRIGCRNRLNLH